METAQGDGQSTYDTCAPAERAGANLHLARRDLQQYARDLVCKIGTPSDGATQNEHLRIDRRNDRRGRKGEQPGGLIDDTHGKRIARLCSLEDLSDRIDLRTAGLLVSPHYSAGAYLVLEATLQARFGLQRIAADG